MTTGEKIKTLREQKGLSQEELGNIIGVQKPAIYKYETGRVINLKRSIIAKLAETLDSTPSYLMGWEEDTQDSSHEVFCEIMNFGENLKYLREKKDMTQEELAKVLGIAKSTISMYENGNREPDFETQETIADFFNVSLDRLMGRKEFYIFSQQEQNLLEKYSTLDEYGKKNVDTLLDNEYERCKSEDKAEETNDKTVSEMLEELRQKKARQVQFIAHGHESKVIDLTHEEQEAMLAELEKLRATKKN